MESQEKILHSNVSYKYEYLPSLIKHCTDMRYKDKDYNVWQCCVQFFIYCNETIFAFVYLHVCRNNIILFSPRADAKEWGQFRTNNII